MMIDGIKILDLAMCSEGEIKRYIQRVSASIAPAGALLEMKIEPCGAGRVSLTYSYIVRRFERISRFTGTMIP